LFLLLDIAYMVHVRATAGNDVSRLTAASPMTYSLQSRHMLAEDP